MGADFFSTSTSIPHGIDNKPIDLDPSDIRAEIDRLIDDTVVKNVETYLNESGKYDFPDDDLFVDTSLYRDNCDFIDGDEHVTREDVVTMLTTAYSKLDDADVEINTMTLTATTGGLSWGDTPTEAFDWISLLGASQIFDAPIVDEADLVMPVSVSAVIEQYVASLPEWDMSRSGLTKLPSLCTKLTVPQGEINELFRLLILKKDVA